VLIS
jgi:hypothetical protein